MVKLQKILVPVDFSETSGVALEYATALAGKFGASLHLLHVIQDPYTQPWGAEAYGVSMPNLLDEMQRQARERLDKLAAADERRGLAADHSVQIGSAFVEILRVARSAGVDLIVMGTHGRGAVAHMLLGSVAERVVRKAPCPVLTVRHPEHTYEQP